MEGSCKKEEEKKKKGGTGVSPVQFFKITRITLPHWQKPGKVYFITWKCKKGEVLLAEERTITLEALHYWDNRKWTLYAAVIMPDHVHALAQPLPCSQNVGIYDLAEIIHSIKSFSVHQINQRRGRRGSFWQDERYDRIVRDEAEFLEELQYIMNNPLKKELVQNWEDYPWLYIKND